MFLTRNRSKWRNIAANSPGVLNPWRVVLIFYMKYTSQPWNNDAFGSREASVVVTSTKAFVSWDCVKIKFRVKNTVLGCYGSREASENIVVIVLF